ncbi:unnamed protein product [Diabrotica balteata]|uniref:Nose resistant to fluoxetine protein 6 n=1 Tax=Diabrotica balteata TaxID=107213 RepID=A0A9N9SQV8_DIABA|nr:unnamed protein product [Diabrotica balteata]
MHHAQDHKDPSQQAKNVVLMGWCMPSSCTPYDLKTYLNGYFNTIDFPLRNHNVSYSSFIEDKNCQREDENNDLDQMDVSFGLVCAIIVSLVISSTLYDCFRNYSNEKLVARSPIASLFLTFSIKGNLKKLPHADDSNPALTILYGMRVICICMIITDHRFGTHLSSAVLNFELVEECMVHSWYLPCDFHYFMVAVILCIVIYKNKKMGLILLSFVTMAAIITPFAIVWYYQKSAVLFFYPDFLRQPKQQEDFLLTYSKSHTRASPYFIGMIAGYLYYRMRGSEKCLKKISFAFSDIVLAFSSAFILYLTVEAPFRNIFSLLLAPPARDVKPKPKPVEAQESVNEVTCDSHL